MQISDRAFILRLTKYQETSYISTLLTSENGVIHTISKGVRSARKNSKGNLFEPGNLVHIELSLNPLKNLQYLQKISFEDSMSGGKFSPLRQSLFTYLVDISEKSVVEQRESAEIYSLMEEYFHAIKTMPKEELPTVPLLYTVQLFMTMGYPVEQWLDQHELSTHDISDPDLPSRAALLDKFIKFADTHFQPLRSPKSLEILRSFLKVL